MQSGGFHKTDLDEEQMLWLIEDKDIDFMLYSPADREL